jgi:hypothetical protein
MREPTLHHAAFLGHIAFLAFLSLGIWRGRSGRAADEEGKPEKVNFCAQPMLFYSGVARS